jgi:hypothetical protein
MFQQEKDSPIYMQKLSSDNEFYNNVFKKTEQIASAVFYVLSYISITPHTQVHFDAVTLKVTAAHTAALEALEIHRYEAKEKLFTLQRALVALESTLRIATAARVCGVEVSTTILHEIDNVQRYIKNHYAKEPSTSSTLAPFSAPERSVVKRQRRERIAIPKNDLSSDAILVYSALSDRTTRIKTVLEAKPEATIKDLTDIITDVSSKTIQRDLNSLIESGEVVRQGERRWSKYSLSQ